MATPHPKAQALRAAADVYDSAELSAVALAPTGPGTKCTVLVSERTTNLSVAVHYDGAEIDDRSLVALDTFLTTVSSAIIEDAAYRTGQDDVTETTRLAAKDEFESLVRAYMKEARKADQ